MKSRFSPTRYLICAKDPQGIYTAGRYASSLDLAVADFLEFYKAKKHAGEQLELKIKIGRSKYRTILSRARA